MKKEEKLTYLMNGFSFQYDFFHRQLNEIFDITLKYPNMRNHTPGWKYIPKNFLMMRRLYRSWEIQKYNIVHFNNTENFLNFKKVPWQVSIAESHGFDFGVYYKWYIKDEKDIFKNIFGRIIDILFWWKIRKKIQEFDIYYCSTPDMLDPLQKTVRKDVKWLPNPINTEIFKPEWEVTKLEWNPACFFPTRLHWDKKPEYAIDIFQTYIKPNFPEATLHLLNQWFELRKYKKILPDTATYFWHDFMSKETLASKIRGSDLCFWDFSIGGLSLMPMQIMACKKAIITYDMHEIVKIPREDLLWFTQQLFEDWKVKEEYVKKNYKYIMDYHTEDAIAKMHLKNLQIFLNKNFNKKI